MPLSGHAPGGAVVGVTITFTVMAAMTVALRLWARHLKARVENESSSLTADCRFAVACNAGWDNILIVFGLVFSIATTITMVIQVREGMGRHQDTIDEAEGMAMLKAFYVSIWVYNLSLSCTKVSILLQYLRIFIQKRFRVACYTLLGVVVVYSLYTFFTAVFACTPIAFFWDPSLGGKCLNRFAIWFANSGINIGTDILTAVLPLPMLKRLELPRRQRRALMIVFALGGFTCIVSILRLQSLYVISQSTDVSWDNPLAAIWSSVEANTAIICSCLPTLRCIFPRLLRPQLSLSGLSRDENSNTNSGRGLPKLLPAMKSKIVSSVSASGPPAYQSYRGDGDGKSDDTSLEELKKSYKSVGGGCKNHTRQKSSCRWNRSSFDEIELEIGSERRPFPNGIHVTTAIEQAVERKDGDDRSRTPEVMRKECDAI